MRFIHPDIAKVFQSFGLMSVEKPRYQISYRLFGRRKNGFSLDVGFNPHGLMAWSVYDESKRLGISCESDFLWEGTETVYFARLWMGDDTEKKLVSQLINLSSLLPKMKHVVSKYYPSKGRLLDEAIPALGLEEESLDEMLLSSLKNFYAPVLTMHDVLREERKGDDGIDDVFPQQELVYRIDTPTVPPPEESCKVGYLGWHPKTGVPWLIVRWPKDVKREAAPITCVTATYEMERDLLFSRGNQSFSVFPLPVRQGFHPLLTANSSFCPLPSETQVLSLYYYRADDQNPGIVIQKSGMLNNDDMGQPIRRCLQLSFVTFPLWLTREKDGILEPLPEAVAPEHLYHILRGGLVAR